jgi:hypothetical protein
MATNMKNLKTLLLKNPKSYSLDIWHEHLLMSVYQVYSNQSRHRGQKLAPPQGVIDFPYLHIVKT